MDVPVVSKALLENVIPESRIGGAVSLQAASLMPDFLLSRGSQVDSSHDAALADLDEGEEMEEVVV